MLLTEPFLVKPFLRVVENFGEFWVVFYVTNIQLVDFRSLFTGIVGIYFDSTNLFLLTYLNKMPCLFVFWVFSIDSFALLMYPTVNLIPHRWHFYGGLLGFSGCSPLFVNLRYKYAPNLFMCSLDIFSSPAAALSYYIPFVHRSVKF